MPNPALTPNVVQRQRVEGALLKPHELLYFLKRSMRLPPPTHDLVAYGAPKREVYYGPMRAAVRTAVVVHRTEQLWTIRSK